MKIKSTLACNPERSGEKQMSEMEPCEICIVTEDGKYKGQIVMRTADRSKFEVMTIYPEPRSGCWWNECCGLTVKPYYGAITLQRTDDCE